MQYLKILRILALVAACGAVPAQESGAYRVGKNDVIRIEVPGDPEFTRDAVAVSETGTVSLSLLGELGVEGLTVSEIAERIRKELVDRKILVQPSVSVSVREYRSQSVTLLGEVRNTGKYYLKGPERLLDILAAAGGTTADGGEITISRPTPEGTRVIAVRSADLLGDRTYLTGGDVIFVRPKEVFQVFVSGEVVSGKPLTYIEGMTVSQAIIMAGGVTRFGSKSKITIKRSSGGAEQILRVNLSDIERGKAKDVPLQPNDLVVIGRRVF
jgi:polysaccharide export outer membrane protein